jgi:hypothetical protein
VISRSWLYRASRAEVLDDGTDWRDSKRGMFLICGEISFCHFSLFFFDNKVERLIID